MKSLRAAWRASWPGILALGLLATAAPLPSVFVVGDSISMHYGPYLAEYLRPLAAYDRKSDDGEAAPDLDVPVGANGGDSRMVLAYLSARARDPRFRPDLLVVNAGLHDIKRNPVSRDIQVSAEEYRSNLEGIHAVAVRIGARLVWITTTPVEDERHNARSRSFHRFDRDRAQYEVIAREVMSRHGVPVIDLYRFTHSLGSRHFIDHVHYDQTACALQAAFIAGSLQQILLR